MIDHMIVKNSLKKIKDLVYSFYDGTTEIEYIHFILESNNISYTLMNIEKYANPILSELLKENKMTCWLGFAYVDEKPNHFVIKHWYKHLYERGNVLRYVELEYGREEHNYTRVPLTSYILGFFDQYMIEDIFDV